MKKFFKKHRKLIGLFMLVLTIVFFIYWETMGRQEFLYTDVIVLKTDVKKGDLITAELLEITKRETDTLIDKVVVNPNLIIGKEANQYIPKNSLLREEYFDFAEVILNDGEYILKLPDDWITSFPDTLRRKDKIYFYPIKNGNIVNEPICFTYIAYVKDGNNREVENLNLSNRLVGTSVIKNIEIVANDDLLNLLTQYYNNEYKFVMLYN